MNVLVIGFGKIGKIKSAIWRELGANVFVYDINKNKKNEILNDGYNIFEVTNSFEGIVDISTPAGHHIKSLKSCIEDESVNASLFIIEKPLVSSLDELKELKDLLRKNSEVGHKIVVNETYYVSEALHKIKGIINSNSEKITEIKIELSKNRLLDTDNGRFFDDNLESIGIEVPHMIAIVELLDIDISKYLDQATSVIYKYIDRNDNQAFVFSVKDPSLEINLCSNLGNFSMRNGLVKRGNQINRKVIVKTDKNSYEILFDPAPGIARLKSQIISSASDDTVTDDDHLRKFLSTVLNGNIDDITRYVGVDNAIKTSVLLLKLRNLTETSLIREPSDLSYSKDKIMSGSKD